MNLVSVDIRDYLIDIGLCFLYSDEVDWSVVIGNLVDYPDKLVSITDSGGGNRVGLFDGSKQQNPNFDIRVRGIDYEEVGKKAYQLDESLDLVDVRSNIILSGRGYEGIYRLGDIYFLHFDERSRPVFGLNYNAKRY